MERKLASIKRITEIRPIAGADAIECAIVGGGWPVVVKKGEFAVNDLALFCEIDAFVPHEIASFLSRGKEPREYNGVKGERLRTIKLRGQLSQGLLLPLSVLESQWTERGEMQIAVIEGDDVTDLLGIQKWEKPIPAQLQGQIRGNFPSWLRKTDQERVQNLDGQIDYAQTYEATIKLDGSSMTIWFKDGEWGVCSRNIDLKTDQEGNTFVDTAKRVISHEVLPGIAWPDNIAIQGELMGPGIQGNRENLKEHEFFVFDIWDIAKQEYYKPEAVCSFCYLYGLEHVPVISAGNSLESLGITSVESALAYAEGESMFNPIREGVVFKREDGSGSFKSIANSFLLGEK